jgi:hypothetical protein
MVKELDCAAHVARTRSDSVESSPESDGTELYPPTNAPYSTVESTESSCSLEPTAGCSPVYACAVPVLQLSRELGSPAEWRYDCVTGQAASPDAFTPHSNSTVGCQPSSPLLSSVGCGKRASEDVTGTQQTSYLKSRNSAFQPRKRFDEIRALVLRAVVARDIQLLVECQLDIEQSQGIGLEWQLRVLKNIGVAIWLLTNSGVDGIPADSCNLEGEPCFLDPAGDATAVCSGTLTDGTFAGGEGRRKQPVWADAVVVSPGTTNPWATSTSAVEVKSSLQYAPADTTDLKLALSDYCNQLCTHLRAFASFEDACWHRYGRQAKRLRTHRRKQKFGRPNLSEGHRKGWHKGMKRTGVMRNRYTGRVEPMPPILAHGEAQVCTQGVLPADCYSFSGTHALPAGEFPDSPPCKNRTHCVYTAYLTGRLHLWGRIIHRPLWRDPRGGPR